MGLYKTISVGASTLTVDGESVGATYDIPLGNPALYLNEEVAFYIIEGNSTTLSTSLAITSTYTPATPILLKFVFDGGVVIGGNNFSVFGQNLTAKEALGPCSIDAWYNGASWNINVSMIEIGNNGVPNSELADFPAETILANSGLSAGSPQYIEKSAFRDWLGGSNLSYPVHVSFESGYTDAKNCFFVPVNGEVTKIGYIVTKDIESTDDAQVEIWTSDVWGTLQNGPYTINIPAGSPQDTGSVLSVSPAGTLPLNSTGATTNYVILYGQKATWGGEVLITVGVEVS